MITINREIITYETVDIGKLVEHYVLIADYGKNKILLSVPNIFLYKITSSSIQTSNRYSNVISKFYRYLSTIDKFKGVDLSKYHVIADNNDLKKWQIYRQVQRVKKQNFKPSSETIVEDAKLILQFFSWLKDSGFITSVIINKRSTFPNFNNNRLLNYVQQQAKVSIDYKNIEALDKESRQKRMYSLITHSEIQIFLKSFDDPVYAAMFNLSLGTAMRPMDLCKFPYIGHGVNRHIMSFSNMGVKAGLVDYLVTASKGNKSRVIHINLADLKVLEECYIIPFYHERAKEYELFFGKKCPPSILFLNKHGRPVTPAMIASRSHDAKLKAMRCDPSFRECVTFYDARHWWPTMAVLKHYKKKYLLMLLMSLMQRLVR